MAMVLSDTSRFVVPAGFSPRPGRRRAFSLLEVIVAMAIFLMSIVVIGQLITLGGEHAIEIEQQGEAVMLAQAKLNEVVAGVVPLSAQADQAFDEAPEYTWSVTADQSSTISNLYTVTVVVTRDRGDGTKAQSTLTQLVLDPAQRGSSEDTVTISNSGGAGGGGGAQSGNTSAQNPAQQQQQTPAAAMQRPGTTGQGAATTAPKTSPTTAPKTGATTAPKTTAPTTTTPKATPPATTPKAATTKKGG
jgi:prepilin-type N-terminal cleavage/methylation domain-containing protein